MKEESSDYTLKNSNIYALIEKAKLTKTMEKKKPRERIVMGTKITTCFYFLLDVNSVTIKKSTDFGNTVKAIKE